MLGAILGDIVGSPYEFDHNNYKHKDFPLLSEKSHFTDDTVMTVAVAVGLIDGKGLPKRTFGAVEHEMQSWGRAYPHAGYGGMFHRWLRAEHPQPYGSFGNGSAIRSPSAVTATPLPALPAALPKPFTGCHLSCSRKH